MAAKPVRFRRFKGSLRKEDEQRKSCNTVYVRRSAGERAADAPQDVAVSAAPNVERRDDLSHSRAEQPGEVIGVPIAAHGRSHGGARCGGRMQIYLGHAAR